VRRTATFVALWFLAGAAATTVAWLGVSRVSEQLAGSGSHPAPLSAEEIRDELAAAPATTTTAAGAATTTSTSTPPQVGGTTTVPTSSPAITLPVAPTTTVPAAGVEPVTRSYDLVGGSATLRFSATGVTVVVATPAPGFTVDIGESHDGGVRVEFEGEDHRSRLDGWWDGGPQDEVREEG
jgi:hypothetical protein